jgi:hypothetical protein
MKFKVGMENGDENRSVAWVLGHPGCFAYGKNAKEALANTPQAIENYQEWIQSHCSGQYWLTDDGIEVELAENFDVIWVNENFELQVGGYCINAWFLHDWKPLTADDIDHSLKLLEWSRSDLMDTISNLSQVVLDYQAPGERWPVKGIIRHIGNAEWWYLDRMGLAFPRSEVPEENQLILEKVRIRLNEVLPSFEGLKKAVGAYAEFWSPRKLVRRAIWHERDHTIHIKKVLSALNK